MEVILDLEAISFITDDYFNELYLEVFQKPTKLCNNELGYNDNQAIVIRGKNLSCRFQLENFLRYGLRHTRHFYTQYFDKKIFQNFKILCQLCLWTTKVSYKNNTPCVSFLQELTLVSRNL